MTTSIGTDLPLAVFGYGAEGRSTLAWLRRNGGRRVRVISAERPAELDAGVDWVVESDIDLALSGIRLLIKSPGIKPSHPLLAAASSRGVPISSATVLFVERAREA